MVPKLKQKHISNIYYDYICLVVQVVELIKILRPSIILFPNATKFARSSGRD